MGYKTKNLVFEGEIFKIYRWKERLFDGTDTVFEQAQRPDSAVIIPFTTQGEIILVKEIKPGSRKLKTRLPAGRIERGETPRKAALRELREETGYKPRKIKLYKKARVGGTSLRWHLNYFVAIDCQRVSNPAPDSGEKILGITILKFDRFLKMVIDRELETYLMTYEFVRAYYDKNFREKLLSDWFE